MSHFADRLCTAVKVKRNSLCVGIDPRWELLPLEVRTRYGAQSLDAVARAYEEFSIRVVDVVAPLVPIIKPQAAFFEACGPAGMLALQRLLSHARQCGLLTILDGKRNDIASTAAAYADAAFEGVTIEGHHFPVWDADALTVNPYLGRDAVEPFLKSARRARRGVFILVRTSNPGASLFQDLNCDGRPLYVRVTEAVAAWNAENVGNCGFGDVGAVVGATYPGEMTVLRQVMPNVLFLVPGLGAQGASAADTASAFRADGLGAVINSSRGITFPYSPTETAWEAAIEHAARSTIAALAADTPMSRLSL